MSVDFLRVSVTDRCNFRCFYCKPTREFSFIPHQQVMRYEEIIDVVKILGELGVRKVRLTGGEPLLRRGIEFLIEELKRSCNIEEVYITVNGYFLAEKAAGLAAAGCDGINISLDTLNPKCFAMISQLPGGAEAATEAFHRVIEGIDAAVATDFPKGIKLNAVALAGVNDTELMALARFAEERGAVMRFIELMKPMSPEAGVPMSPSEILAAFTRYGIVEPLDVTLGNGPAEYYRVEGTAGQGAVFGVIESMSPHICDRCNRLRLTSDGRVMQCLFQHDALSIKPLLELPGGLKQVRKVLEAVILAKTPHKDGAVYGMKNGAKSDMYRIGG